MLCWGYHHFIITLMMDSFPEIHSFPPFYTRQLHEETWRKQQQLWIEMILTYCASKRIFEIDLQQDSLYQSPLFYNSQIDRKMDREFLKELATEMVRTERASLRSNGVYLIFWRRPSEWAQSIYKYVERIGSIGSIFTIYDLIDGDDTIKEDFHGIPDSIMKLAVAELEKTGKARLFSDSETTNTSSFKESGMKFF